MENMAYLIGAIVGSIVSGLIVGAIPAIVGGVKGKLGLGFAGLGCCVVGSLILGLFLSVPLCIVFLILILRKGKQVPPPYYPNTSGAPQGGPYQQPGGDQQPPQNAPYRQPGAGYPAPPPSNDLQEPRP